MQSTKILKLASAIQNGFNLQSIAIPKASVKCLLVLKLTPQQKLIL